MVDVLGADAHTDGSAPAEVEGGPESRARYHAEIFLVSLAGLLLEIGYTRIISFKLFYYYTYLVIGLALLGLGCGAVLVALSRQLRERPTPMVLRIASLFGAVSIGVSYLVVSVVRIDTLDIWQYGHRTSFTNLARLVVVCFAIFVSFVPIGVIIATLFGRQAKGIGGLYFADLVGAGLGGVLAVPLVDHISAPSVVMLSGLIMGVASLRLIVRDRKAILGAGALVILVLLLVPLFSPSTLPDVRTEASKEFPTNIEYTKWNSVFRIDAVRVSNPAPDRYVLYHDGLIGSSIYRYDGNPNTLGRYDHDPRAFPFAALGTTNSAMIIGAAGGNEILASIHFKVPKIEAVELNPVTYSLVKGKYADFGGHLADQPGVKYVNADGRSYLARSHEKFDLVWYPAPDSYAATNTSTSGAFVLSESYLYTKQAIEESLKHTTPNGIVAAQFGEVNYSVKPNRTSRYVTTARSALAEQGVTDLADHIIVLRTPTDLGGSTVSTILVKKAPFTPAEVTRVVDQIPLVRGAALDYAPGEPVPPSQVSKLVTLPADKLSSYEDSLPYDVSSIGDNRPYFWHFSRFTDVVKHFDKPINRADPEDSTGERVLILLLGVTVVFAAVFLLLPFIVIRKRWTILPRKGRSAIYFAALGLGFMLYEISMIQRLTLFLGYPTYSLTVTLASLLTFTGVGALLSNRFVGRAKGATAGLLGALIVLTAAYLFGLPPLTHALQDGALALRITVTVLVLAPLGLCLGCFMPIGLREVAALTEFEREYVAWGWAINGFASVIGSVLTTMIAMTFGLQVALELAVLVYAVAVLALRTLVPAVES